MIVGADAAADGAILKRAEGLYGAYGLRRVYYSAFSPIPDSTARLPLQRPPLIREHRLYQADWLMRFYGFARAEIAGEDEDLDLAIDPKLAWALKHRGDFPVDVNIADRERLLRVPGLGVKAVDRILEVRRFKRLELADLGRLSRSVGKLKPFLVAADWSPGPLIDRADLRGRLEPRPQQLQLF
jgi:predicted DNA-binding helix-hairpin-helix protein